MFDTLTKDIMTRNDGMYPFYRQAVAAMPYHELHQLSHSFGAKLRQDYSLWTSYPDRAMGVSNSLIYEMWKRLN